MGGGLVGVLPERFQKRLLGRAEPSQLNVVETQIVMGDSERGIQLDGLEEVWSRLVMFALPVEYQAHQILKLRQVRVEFQNPPQFRFCLREFPFPQERRTLLGVLFERLSRACSKGGAPLHEAEERPYETKLVR